ncbi:hypothetical protein ASG32_08070 [Methylobacterium sp. Leaf361]|uniref:hypothetical protein n=1 Tax=Methylobacterium sp. Leaf361 TaxID=1736352 RepID=UPI0006F486F2|nr:hypothetical protein [Methylobacterium sp. Leaf361]KQS75043.1 hypothetical protein ASG32_08070 [Methylobacterium sp. Leaf361]
MSGERDYKTLAEAAVYDETGRITGVVNQAIGFTQDWQDRGERILIGDAGWDQQEFRTTRYVKLTGKTPKLVDRPVLAGVPEQATASVGTEVSIPRVPACTVRFDGPVSGTHEHPGGSLKIGFTLTGTYRISFEAFPNLPCSFDLTVTP